MASIVYPTFSGWVTESIYLHQGESWDAADPFVREHPQFFTSEPGEALRQSGRYVEQATAAPGEKRATAPRATRTVKADTEP